MHIYICHAAITPDNLSTHNLKRTVSSVMLSRVRLRLQRRSARSRLTSHPLLAFIQLWTRSRHLRHVKAWIRGTLLQRSQQLYRGFGCQILVVVIVDLYHGRIYTSTQTFNLEQTEDSVLGHLSIVNAQFLLYCLHDLVGAAATKHAWCSRADLYEELSDGVSVEHGVEGCDFVDTHRGHVEEARDFVHDGNGCEAVLTLAEI